MPRGEVVHVRHVHGRVDESGHASVEVVQDHFARGSRAKVEGPVRHRWQHEYDGRSLGREAQDFVFGDLFCLFVVPVEMRQISDVVFV